MDNRHPSRWGVRPIPDRVLERALTRVSVNSAGCWISDYSVASHGYAQIGWQESGQHHMVTAHRASWTAAHGPIPVGMTVDHTCRVRRCVNPAHLRLLDNQTNARDNGSQQTSPTTDRLCGRGHALAVGGNGKRYCRECKNERTRRRRALLRRSA